ncbi:MAG: DUF72 domain-containing protein [Acidobacteriota bacterium]|nr:DUF72 domain-containing protein [Acidobacteriota bacterium]
MSVSSYFLGLPLWGLSDWRGNLYSADARPADFLRQYARVFNTVEGNTTFYSVPTAETVERWREATPASFRFCFKFPQRITHELRLRGAGRETTEFLRRMTPLGERLGPFMIQFPRALGPSDLDLLGGYLGSLPEGFRYAVEVRHPALHRSPGSAALSRVLRRLGAERVIMDTRALRAGDPDHPDVAAARHAKPDLPVAPEVTGRHPLVRWVGHPSAAVSDPWLEDWARVLGAWIRGGWQPYFMVHCPNNLHAPPFARRFHRMLAGDLDVGSLAPWPGETAETADGQLSLLGPF